MKRLFSYITMLLLAAPIWAQSDCETAPLINESFSVSGIAPGDYWISAWTYDLPLNMVFTPNTPLGSAPTAELDFRCGDGRYPTDELENFFHPKQEDGVIHVITQMPATFTFTHNADGSYSFAVPASYRDLMFRAGLTEDVRAYVKLHFPVGGDVAMNPTEEFRDCVGEGLDSWVTLGDTLTLDATNENETFVCPVALWKNDSIRFVWTGDDEAELTFHYTCDVDGETLGNTMVSDYYTIPAHGELRLSQAEVKALYDEYEILADMVDLPAGSTEGMYYAFVTRSGEGKLVIEKTPLPEAENGAILLEYGKEVTVSENQLYCFLRTDGPALEFVSADNNPCSVYFSEDADFVVSEASDSIVSRVNIGEGACAYLDRKALSALQELALYENSPYIYVRFACAGAVVMNQWDNVCAPIMTELAFDTKITIKSSGNGMFRLYYPDIVGCELSVKWTPQTARKNLTLAMTNSCDINTMGDPEHQFGLMDLSSTAQIITVDVVASWADKVDEDGFIYLSMNSSSNGKVQFTATKVEIPEPETCKETEYKAQVTVEQYCDTLLPYKWQVYEGRELSIAEAGMHYDTIFSYLSDGTTRCDSVIYTLSLDTIHCKRPAPEPPSTGGGEEEGDEGDGDGDEGEEGGEGGEGEGGETGGSGSTGGSGEGSSTGGGGETGGNQNTPNPPTPGPGFPEPNHPTGSVIYRGVQTISAVCVANAGNVTGAADGIVEVRVTKVQELRLMQGSVELERWTQQPGDVHRLTLREGVTYTLRGLETLYLRR